MLKSILTFVCVLWATYSFAQSSFMLNGRKIELSGKSSGKFTLSTEYVATYQDFYEIKGGKLSVINVQTFLDQKDADNKDVVIYTAPFADINTDMFEERFIIQDENHTSFKEDSYEVRLYPKEGKEFNSWNWGRSNRAGETPEEYTTNSVRIVFAKLQDAKAFMAQLKKQIK
jgi:hypothetical protein